MEIPTKMTAWLYKPGHSNYVMDKNYQIRQLKDDEILLKVSACGVCHSDVLVLSGLTLETRTYVAGHEISGKPVRLGSQVDKRIQLEKLYSVLAVDKRTRGTKDQPALFNTIGLGKDGGYAEYVIVKADDLVEVPEGVSAEAAAVASDAGTTSYSAVKHTAGITNGDKVLIFGIGGLGHLAVQFAKHLGATVYACDFKPAARKLALDLGADAAFDLIELTEKTKSGFAVDCTIDFVASSQTFQLGMAALSGNDMEYPAKSKLVMVGGSDENLSFTTPSTIASGIQILSSAYGPRSAMEEVLQLFAKGTIHPHFTVEGLKNVGKAINELRAFEITGRKVIVPS
ncbi:alcohol dehydrogenase [Mycena venus]|uniref:Alcohol dehydrogenase n=1 Tax=Mycena venus TaxID=2733690 RepID=A0A8H6XDD4_9AGAR|nr:alcohol dehydrogenase [Mycena venus]